MTVGLKLTQYVGLLVVLSFGMVTLGDVGETRAQTSSAGACSRESLELTLSTSNARLNRDSSMRIYVVAENLTKTVCRSSIVLVVPDHSHLGIIPLGDVWLDNSSDDLRTLTSKEIKLVQGNPVRVQADLEITSSDLKTGHYRVKASLASADNYSDWRDIWAWSGGEDNGPKIKNCSSSMPVVREVLSFDSGMLLITPLSLSFDCGFGYTILDALVENCELGLDQRVENCEPGFDQRVENREPGLRLILSSRDSILGSNTFEEFGAFNASPADEQSGRFTFVFDGVPRQVPGLRVSSAKNPEVRRELVPYSPGLIDRLNAELTDAYEAVIETKMVGLFAYVGGVATIIVLWLMLNPIGQRGERYKWSPAGLIWTVSSVGLVVGTYALVAWSVASLIGAILAGQQISELVYGATLTFLSILVGILFANSLVRQRRYSHDSIRDDKIRLPWWLQGPFSCHDDDPWRTDLPRRERRDGPRTIWDVFRRPRGQKSTDRQAPSVGWRWVVVLFFAGSTSLVSAVLLTP